MTYVESTVVLTSTVGVMEDGHLPDLESRRQVVIDVLAGAITDLLLEKHLRVRGKYEAATR